MPTGSGLPARFWAKLTRHPSGCLIWTAAKTSRGYGAFGVDGTSRSAHVLAYEDAHGPLAAGLTVDHECHNLDPACPGGLDCLHKLCCEPAHLFARPIGENVARSHTSGARVNAAKTHCPAGHPYAGDNLYVNPRGGRECRICQRAHRTRPVRLAAS